jgi:hypothetical protein
MRFAQGGAVDAEPFTTLTPTFFAGKGFGFFPESMKFLKPFAVTAQVGYAVPTESSTTAIDEETSNPGRSSGVGCFSIACCPFRKFHPAWIRVIRQNHRIIGSDVCDAARARHVRRRPVQVALPA